MLRKGFFLLLVAVESQLCLEEPIFFLSFFPGLEHTTRAAGYITLADLLANVKLQESGRRRLRNGSLSAYTDLCDVQQVNELFVLLPLNVISIKTCCAPLHNIHVFTEQNLETATASCSVAGGTTAYVAVLTLLAINFAP